MQAKIKVLKTENNCELNGEPHHLFALEFVSDESAKVSVIPLACTKCGTMFLTRVQV